MGQERQSSLPSMGSEIFIRTDRIMTSVDDDIENFILGGESALPGFHLQQVKQFLLAI